MLKLAGQKIIFHSDAPNLAFCGARALGRQACASKLVKGLISNTSRYVEIRRAGENRAVPATGGSGPLPFFAAIVRCVVKGGAEVGL